MKGRPIEYPHCLVVPLATVFVSRAEKTDRTLLDVRLEPAKVLRGSQLIPVAPRFNVGAMAYLENYWVDIVSYSPKARNVRYRRLGEKHIRYMRRVQFERGAREHWA